MESQSRDRMPVVCVDLDGVLNTFDMWRGSEFFHPPRSGVEEFLGKLNEAGFRVVILTVRYAGWVERWLEENDLLRFGDRVNGPEASGPCLPL